MSKRILVALSAVGLLALTACSPGADAEAEYLKQVHAEIEVSVSDEALVSMAKDACSALKEDDRMRLMGIALSSGIDADDAAWTLGVGVAHLCPDQGDKLG